ncbi:retinol dehydrogenase 13 [Amyelois transitella]|uniref:retinol dehydrogenase 13 n=1 Tax=Amyelois transitella TaxID=680683 RepID=UPI00067E5F82|nr:retinol dehydrogenase 13 [Amyelois transitella]
MFIVFIINALNSLMKALCILMLIVGLYQKNTNRICKSKKRLDGKTAIVTGGTTGLGLEIAKDLAHRGAKVIVACPFEDEGNNAREFIARSSGNDNVEFKHLDLSTFASVRQFATAIKKTEDRLDILVNNAGVCSYVGKHITDDGLNLILQVNYFGTVLLTLLLLPLLKKTGNLNEPSRIVNTTSLSHFIGKVDFAGWRKPLNSFVYYPSSKLCIALYTRELAKRIHNFDVLVNVVDPGLSGTPMLRKVYGALLAFVANVCFKNAWEGAQTAIFAAVSDEARVNGKYLCNCKEASPSRVPFSFDDDEKRRLLWEKTMDVVKFADPDVLQLVKVIDK